MSEAENKPSIRIHLDQQVTIEAVKGHEDVEDAMVATEITGFDVEDDLYVLRGALSFSGFLRQEDPNARVDAIPDSFDDGDIFATDDAVAEAPVLPFHHRLPFLLQVPVAAQLQHQRENGILNVNPKIGQWNVHVLGEQTVHLRAELVIQGLSAQEGYVFRCGSQEEGVAASKLDTLLDQEEAHQRFAPEQPQAEAEFEAPFEPVQWNIEAGAHFAEAGQEQVRAQEQAEDDWVIESPTQEAVQPEANPFAAQFAQQFGQPFGQQFPHALQADGAQAAGFRQAQYPYPSDQQPEEENEVVFTPDPRMVFPMPEPNSEWARQLEEVDRAFGEAVRNQQVPFAKPQSMEDLYEQAQRIVNEMQDQFSQGYQPNPDAFPAVNFDQLYAAQQQFQVPQVPQEQAFVSSERQDEARAFEQEQQVEDEEAFVLEEETRQEEAVLEEVSPFTEATPLTTSSFDTPAAVSEVTSEVSDMPADVFHAQEDEEERPVVAEYEFEDEVPEGEASADPVPETVQGLAHKAVGPKLSVGGKGSQAVVDSPIKLSSLLGESRARESASVPEQTAKSESSSFQAAQLIRESQSYSESQTYVESAYQASFGGESASVQTSKLGHNSDSIWGDILTGSETKVTMKFRIVQEQDSLDDLADLYNTSVGDLVRANNLQRQDVEQGQILYIPTRRR